jgi:tetratricopeptide (TPR) repeat protein
MKQARKAETTLGSAGLTAGATAPLGAARNLRWVALAMALAMVPISLLFGDYDRAETHLRDFYSQVSKADFDGARRSIDEAVRLWPSNARYHAWRGYAMSQNLPSQCSPARTPADTQTREPIAAAAAEYRRAIALNGRDAVAHHNLAWLEHLLGRDKEARLEWEQAVALDPDTAIFHMSLGFFLEEAGEIDAAQKQYVAAIELAPAILDSPFFARYRKRATGRAEATLQLAINETETRLGNGRDPILEARLGKFYQYRGEMAGAGAMLERAKNELSSLPLVWFNLGEVFRLEGKREEAWDCYSKAQFLDGSLAGPPLRMGEMYREAGQRAQAVSNLRAATQKWARVRPVTAGHNTRLYGGAPQPIDDLLPTTLVWYASPCEASEAYTLLASLFPENDLYRTRSTTCESLPDPHSAMARDLAEAVTQGSR